MVATFHGVAPDRSVLKPTGIDPGDGSCQHAKMQVVAGSLRVTGLSIGATDIAFQLFKQGKK